MTPIAGSSYFYIPSLELIILVITVMVNGVITMAVYRSDPKSATNRIFSLLSLFTILWLATNFLVRSPMPPEILLALHRLGIFFAAPMSSLFFLLAHTIPSENIRMKRRNFYLVIMLTLLMMALNISPYAFTRLNLVNNEFEPSAGAGLIPFALISTIFSILAIYWLFIKYARSEGVKKKQMKLVLLGMLIMLALIIATVLVPIIFSSIGFLALTPLYTLVFLGMTAYAIVRHQLFNIKVIATDALTGILWIILFSRIIVSGSFAQRIVDSFILILSVVFGILLIRSVRREVRQREEVERLNKELERVNAKLGELSRFKTQLLSLASHQIKAPLSAIKGYVSIIADGLYGPVGEPVKKALGKVKDSANNLIELIDILLDLRRAEEGRMDYHFAKTDLSALVEGVVSELKPLAEGKKISLEFSHRGNPIFVEADSQKLRQVIQNLVDNAVKYTPHGFVKVELHKKGNETTLSVEDSGLGIPKELMPFLFEEFIRDSRIKRKILGTGLGLFIAKKIVQAHGGKIWAESEGEDKGSKFSVTLPVPPAHKREK